MQLGTLFESNDEAAKQRIYTYANFKCRIEFFTTSNGGHFEGIILKFVDFYMRNKKKRQQFFTSNNIGVISISISSLLMGHYVIIIL